MFAKIISKRHEKKVNATYQFIEGDVHLDLRQIIIYSIIAAAGGVACGLLGIAGGLIIGPLLLEMGLLPEVASATNAFIVLFITFCTVVQYFIFGTIEISFMAYFSVISIFGSLFGLAVLKKIVDYYQRPSIIVFALLLVIIIAAVILPLRGVINLVDDINKGSDNLWFQPLCK